MSYLPPSSSASLHFSGETTPLLKATGLRKSFGGQVVLDAIDLELYQGEVVLLRGENGSGKTTLLNILTGNLEPDAGEIQYNAADVSRTYRFPRRWWRNLNPWDHFRPEFVAAEGMGRTWQDIRLFRSLLLRDNIVVAEPGQPGENPLLAALASKRTQEAEARTRALANSLLAQLGLKGRELSSADKISLGQSKRVGIARAVTAGARVLFLDEPIAGLDGKGVIDIISLLSSLLRERQITLVIVEHVFNQPHIRELVTTDWLLENGKLKIGRASACCSSAKHENHRSSRPDWRSIFGEHEAEILDEDLPRGALLTRILRPKHFSPDSTPILEIRNLIVTRGQHAIIDGDGKDTGFNLALRKGEIVILQAPNGWGKSTLFAALCGIIDVTRGEIILQGEPVQDLLTWDRVRKGLSALPSDQHTFPNLTATETLMLAGKTRSLAALGALYDRRVSSLSGGERQRVALLATADSLVKLLDEPFSGLDQAGVTAAAALILRSFNTVLIAIPSLSC